MCTFVARPGSRCDPECLFERFTEQARQVVVVAQDEARALNHNYIGTEHILLGLLREGEGVAARVLVSLGVTLELVRAQVVEVVGPGEGEVTHGQIPFTPRAKKVLELALREALSLGHNHIGPEHILLGLSRDNEGVASRILLACDADAEKIRNEVMRLVPGPGPHPAVATLRRESGFDPWIRVGPAAGLRRLLMIAAARALDDGRTEIDASDILLALTRDQGTGPLLAGLGVDEAAVRDAIERAGTSEEPPEASAEG
jgi:ATP-dependent Clp protease ATP-binding subunit ClpC